MPDRLQLIDRTTLIAFAALTLALPAACADTTGSSPWSPSASDDTEDGGSNACRQLPSTDTDACNLPDDAVDTRQVCGTTVYGSPDQFDGEPRDRPALEVLAFEHADTMTAPDCLYRRLERDVTTIADQFDQDNGPPPLYDAPHDGRSLELNVNTETADAIENGTHEMFECLLDHYGPAEYAVHGPDEAARVSIRFDSTRDVERVADSYRDLPGLVERDGRQVETPTYNDLGAFSAHGSDICLNVDGDTHEYLVERRWGDCIGGGCINSRTRHFTSTTGELCKSADSRDSADDLPDPSTICE